jgi:protein-S-isoprenylcysteine O-methyltransferase Ste14
MQSRRVMPTTYLLLAIVLMIALHFVYPWRTVMPGWWRLVGILAVAAGVALNVVADKAFRAARTTLKPFEESSALVTRGVFHFTRNPMYVGFLLVLIGVALLLGSLTPWVVVAGSGILLDRQFVAIEERMLARRFGEEWKRYTLSTPRWI